MVEAFRERERVIERVWNPLKPNFLTYTYGGQLYGRTFALASVTINAPEVGIDSMPFGFFFERPPSPPLVPINAQVTLSSFNAVGGLGNVGGSNPTGLGTINPSPITNPTAIPPAAASTNLLRIDGAPIPCGLQSTPLSPTPRVVSTITILAPGTNTGTIYVSGSFNQAAGQGFPLVPGASVTYGEIASAKYVDLSTIFVIGTNPADMVFITPQT